MVYFTGVASSGDYPCEENDGDNVQPQAILISLVGAKMGYIPVRNGALLLPYLTDVIIFILLHKHVADNFFLSNVLQGTAPPKHEKKHSDKLILFQSNRRISCDLAA